MKNEKIVQSFKSNRFEPIAKIGYGNMGTVYECKDTHMKRTVALKILNVKESEHVAARFQVEAKAAAQLDHPNIVKVLDFGQLEDGQLFLAMEFLEGESLESLINSSGAIPESRAIPILIQIARALECSHKNNVLHRDVKPSNVSIVKDEKGKDLAKVLDFGTAKLKESEDQSLTKTGSSIGTPTYMSPEAAQGQKLTTTCDIYSFGCLMYELLTGERPFVGNSSFETMYMHINEEAPKLSQKIATESIEELEEIVRLCMEKDPGNRIQTFSEIIAHLEPLTEKEPEYFEELEPQSAIFKDTTVIKLVSILVALLLIGTIYYFATKSFQETRVIKDEDVKPLVKAKEDHDLLEKVMDERATIAPSADDEHKYVVTGVIHKDKTIFKDLIDNKNIRALVIQIPMSNLAGDTLEYVVELPLERLYIHGADIDNQTLALIGRIKNLKKLTLMSCFGHSNEGYKSLVALPRLEYLDLRHTVINNQELNTLTSAESIQSLNLWRCLNLKPDALNILAKFPNLIDVTIANSGIENGSLQDLPKLNKLKSLTLGKLPNEFPSLLEKTKIESLHFYQAEKITDKDILNLSAIKNLKYITISDCPKISESFVKNFNKQHKRVKIDILKATSREAFLQKLIK